MTRNIYVYIYHTCKIGCRLSHPFETIVWVPTNVAHEKCSTLKRFTQNSLTLALHACALCECRILIARNITMPFRFAVERNGNHIKCFSCYSLSLTMMIMIISTILRNTHTHAYPPLRKRTKAVFSFSRCRTHTRTHTFTMKFLWFSLIEFYWVGTKLKWILDCAVQYVLPFIFTHINVEIPHSDVRVFVAMLFQYIHTMSTHISISRSTQEQEN